MIVDFYRTQWNNFVVFPTIEIDLGTKEVCFAWLWFKLTIGL